MEGPAPTGTPLTGAEPPERLEGAPRIWAVGGGKGGVGKSVVASSLAAGMAATGRRCAIVDADLGGANLHTLLGATRPRYTLSHFLTGEVASLAELMVQTSVPNLWLVSGNRALLEMANPNPGRKEKLFRHIRGLDVEEVLLDLGAGSAFNVIDFFLLARRGLVVVTPEPTAIENTEHFLRAAFYRSLKVVARRPEVHAAILRVKEQRRGRRVSSARELIACVREIDPTAAKLLAERAQAFAPLLLVNQVQTLTQRRVGPDLAARCRDRLGVSIEFAGSLHTDPSVPEAVVRRRPTLQLFPRCRFSQHIDALAQRLLQEEWQAPEHRRNWEGRSCRFPRSERGRPPTPAAAEAPARRPERGPVAAGPPAAGPCLPSLDLLEPGAYLRRCRERLGLSLAEMTERTRIRWLDDIENERFEKLPPEPYLKRFVIEYGRELGVPELEALTASYLGRRQLGA